MPRKPVDPREEARRAFIRGVRNDWTAGGHGFTVYAYADRGRLMLRWTKPKRTQQQIFDRDTPELREKLTDVASEKALRIRSARTAAVVQAPAVEAQVTREPITVESVWLTFVRDRWRDIPNVVIAGGRREVRAFYEQMSPEHREQCGDPDYLLSVLQAMRRIMESPQYPPNRLLDEIDKIAWADYVHWRRTVARTSRGTPYSLRTIATDHTRFHTAIKHCRLQRELWWGATRNPIEGVAVNRATANLPEITDAQAKALVARLRAGLPTSWRTLAAVLLAFASGRRIGAIGADRLGFDADGLRGNDFFTRGDTLWVVWRAAASKANAFGRGDTEIPATGLMKTVYRWLRRHHPNPLGLEHPLLWSPEDATMPVTYEALGKGFKKAWVEEFGNAPPRGLAFHGFCRTVATTIGDSLGLDKAAEYTGRTRGTLEKYYKRVRPETLADTVKKLDELRRADGGSPHRLAEDDEPGPDVPLV